ncbi:MAG: hypothetical protein ACFB9N_15240 [Geitlerinemataceae cyanobacterium]
MTYLLKRPVPNNRMLPQVRDRIRKLLYPTLPVGHDGRLGWNLNPTKRRFRTA